MQLKLKISANFENIFSKNLNIFIKQVLIYGLNLAQIVGAIKKN